MKQIKIEQPQTEPDFSKLTAENILDFDISGIGYDNRLKYRERLQQIRREKDMDFGYTKDIWNEHMLKMFLEENEGGLDPAEMLFQEKKECLNKLIRSWTQAGRVGQGTSEKKKLDDFYDKCWDFDRDDAEDTRRYLGARANNPIQNSPANFEGETNLDSGRERDPRTDWFFRLEKELTDEQRKFVEFVRGLGANVQVLDLGCGRGSAFVKMLVEINQLESANRINIDLDPRNIEYLNQNPKNGKNISADAADIPLPDESVDLLVFNMVLADNYVSMRKQKQIFEEIKRVLRAGGYLYGLIGIATKHWQKDFEKNEIGGSWIYRKKS
ncbi:MAG: class I SAM-dependent methyltransferase [Patescibacteria group bacterium]